jgi:hypothetical protein
MAEVGAVQLHDVEEAPEVEWGAAAVDAVLVQLQLLHQQAGHVSRQVVGDLQSDGPLEAPPAQFHLDRGQQVVGLFLFGAEASGASRAARRRRSLGERQLARR